MANTLKILPNEMASCQWNELLLPYKFTNGVVNLDKEYSFPRLKLKAKLQGIAIPNRRI